MSSRIKRKFTSGQKRVMKRARADPYYSSSSAMAGKRNAGARRMLAANVRTGGFLGMTTKFYDTAVAGAIIASPTDCSGGEVDPATVLCISAPAQGDGEQNRDGNRALIKSAFITGILEAAPQANQTAGDAASAWMVALVLDTQTNGAQLNSEDVYVNPSAATLLAGQPLRNLQYSSRFRVLKTVKGHFSQPNMAYDGTNIEQGGARTPFTMSWSGSLPVQFKGGATAAGVAGVADNSLHVIAFTTGTDLAPVIRYNARVRFQG